MSPGAVFHITTTPRLARQYGKSPTVSLSHQQSFKYVPLPFPIHTDLKLPPTRTLPWAAVSQNHSLHPRTRLRLRAQRHKNSAPRLNVLVHIRRKIEAMLTPLASFRPLQVVPLSLPPRKAQMPMPLLFDVIPLPILTPSA
jgi:hypothetical protein